MAQSSPVGPPLPQAAGEQRWPPFQYYVKVTGAVLLTLLGGYLIYRARSILVLIFLGMFLAVGLEPVIQRLERAEFVVGGAFSASA